MKFDPAKAWPHPVLRPVRYGDDYPRAEFEVEIQVRRAKANTTVDVDATFELSDPDLLQLVAREVAQYVLLVKAPSTHFRETVFSAQAHIAETFPSGTLSGRVEFSPFLICTSDLPAFSAAGWHPDFEGRSFDLPAGAVLATDVPKDYWIDTADETRIASIFGHRERPDMDDGLWRYELGNDRIWILMSTADSERYAAARDACDSRPEGQYLLNGLYLPVLISVLHEVDRNVDDYADSRWFASLDERLHDTGCTRLGSPGAGSRSADAQRLLGSPFLRMPMIAQAGASAND